MKNTISYYYNLVASDIHQSYDKYKFTVSDKQYLFMPYYGDINKVFTIYSYLIKLNIYCHEIVYNKDNEVYTFVFDKPYILIKIHYNFPIDIDIDLINSYNIFINTDVKCNWYKLWCDKIDYYEYQINQYGKKYPLIRESFSYYDGLCETAISLINVIDINKVKMYLNHHRIDKNTNFISFYNPLNMILDVKIRDVCEYFKEQFFENIDVINSIDSYLTIANLTYEETVLFLARMIYPSYYFDLYDKVIQGKCDDTKLNYYINRVDDYEMFLSKLYLILSKYYKLPEIEWIIKT